MTKQYTNTREPGEFGDGVTVEREDESVVAKNATTASADKLEVVGYVKEGDYRASGFEYISERSIDVLCVPLVRHSDAIRFITACQQEIDRLRAEVDGLKAEPFDTREGLSKWRGWDDSNYPWSQTHHKDSVLEAMFRDSWSVEDAAALLGFIDRTWGEQSNEA